MFVSGVRDRNVIVALSWLLHGKGYDNYLIKFLLKSWEIWIFCPNDFFKICVCVCVSHVRALSEPRRRASSLELELIGSCELYSIGAGNRIQSLSRASARNHWAISPSLPRRSIMIFLFPFKAEWISNKNIILIFSLIFRMIVSLLH